MAKLKHALTLTCVIYTVIISAMFALGWVLSDSASLLVPTPSKALLMLAFSAVLGFASLILKKDKTGAALTVLHYVICLAAFAVTVVVAKVPLTGSVPVVGLILFTIIYATVMLIRAVVYRRRVKNTVIPEEYTSVFK